MSVVPTLNLRFVLTALILIWLMSFPAKGVFFQFSLYLLPILVLAFRRTRLLFKRDRSVLLLLSVSLALPLFLSELRSLIFNGGSLSTDPFNVFWRLAFFPVVLAVACDYGRFPIRKLQNSLVLVAVIYGVVGIGSSLFHFSLNNRNFGWRIAGIVSNPNPFGFLMIAATLIAIQQLIRAVTKREAFLFMLVVVLLMVAGALSGSRSALLGGVLGLVLLLGLQRKSIISRFCGKKKIWIIGVGSTLLLIPLLLWQLPHMDQLQGRFIGASGNIRLQIWQYYLGLVSENPFLGVPLSAKNKLHYLGKIYGPHNMYLSVLVHSGLVGLAGLLTVLGWLVKRITCSNNINKHLCLALLLLLCVFCFFNSSFFGSVMTQGGFALIVAMTLSREVPLENETQLSS